MAHRASNARVSRVPELITAGDRILQFFNQVGEDIVEGMKAVADAPEQPNKMQEVSCMCESGGGERVRKKERKRFWRGLFFSLSLLFLCLFPTVLLSIAHMLRSTLLCCCCNFLAKRHWTNR
jgi:hypothetical protein